MGEVCAAIYQRGLHDKSINENVSTYTTETIYITVKEGLY